MSDILPHTSPAKQCRQLANMTAQSMWGDGGEKGWGGMPSEITFCYQHEPFIRVDGCFYCSDTESISAATVIC